MEYLIDSHLHLPTGASDGNIDKIVNEAALEGVTKLITIGTSLEDSEESLKISSKFPGVYATVAIYPHEHINLTVPEISEKFETIIKKGFDRTLGYKLIVIGECGIDITEQEKQRPLDEQVELFEMQVVLAIKNKLPLVIHNRNGDAQIISILKQYKTADLTGVVHCFSSTWETAKEFLDLGFYISFSGMITYPVRKELREVLRKVPQSKILVETDSPYLAPQGHRGEINHPKYVKIVALKVAEVRDELFDDVCRYTYSNTRALFNLS